MIQRTFASLLLIGLLSACGDGGRGTSPPPPIGNPPANPQDPPVNPNQPPKNPNQPPTNGAGGAAQVDPGDNGDDKAGRDNSGPGNSCMPAKGCVCDNDCDSCRCSGVDKSSCDLLCD
jgi:hypothetical protein